MTQRTPRYSFSFAVTVACLGFATGCTSGALETAGSEHSQAGTAASSAQVAPEEKTSPDEGEELEEVPNTAGEADDSGVAPDSTLTRRVLEKIEPQDPGDGTPFAHIPEYDFLCDNTFGSGPQVAGVLDPETAASSFEWRFTHNLDLIDPVDPVDGSECILYASADDPEWDWHTLISFTAIPDAQTETCPFIREDLGGYCEDWDNEGTVIMALPDAPTQLEELRQLVDSARFRSN